MGSIPFAKIEEESSNGLLHGLGSNLDTCCDACAYKLKGIEGQDGIKDLIGNRCSCSSKDTHSIQGGSHDKGIAKVW